MTMRVWDGMPFDPTYLCMERLTHEMLPKRNRVVGVSAVSARNGTGPNSGDRVFVDWQYPRDT